MRSPVRISARAAGVSSIGATTFTKPFFHRDLDAEPAKLALGLDAHVLEAVGVEIA